MNIKDLNLIIRFLKEEDLRYFYFYQFLKKNNCFTSYFFNLIKEHPHWRHSDIQMCVISYLKREFELDWRNLIIGAFGWEETNEKSRFWEDIHFLWRLFIVKQQKI